MSEKTFWTLYAAALLLSAVLFALPSEPGQGEAPAGKEVDLESFEHDLRGMGFEKTFSEALYPSETITDGEGHEIRLWTYACDDPARMSEGFPSLIRKEVFDPETAESSRGIQLDDRVGTLYEKDGRAYLIWPIVEERYGATLVLDHPPIC